MKSRLCVLYFPGLGDDAAMGQRLALRCWKLLGVDVVLVPMRWSSNESWSAKKQRILAQVDASTIAYQKVGVVGASAGAAAAVWAFVQRSQTLTGCAAIAGKINRPESIGPHYRRQNVALLDAVRECEAALAGLAGAERRQILSLYGITDSVVERADSVVAGAQNRTVWAYGHALIIATQITIGAPRIARFLGAKTRQ